MNKTSVSRRLKQTAAALCALFMLVGATACDPAEEPQSSEAPVTTTTSTTAPTEAPTDTTTEETTTTTEETTTTTTEAEDVVTDPEPEPTEPEPTEDPLADYVQLQIYNNKVITENFQGFNAVYHPYTYKKDQYGRNYTEEMATIEMDRIKTSGINIARGYYDASFAWDAVNKTWNWESDDMKALYRWCKELEKRGVDVLLNHWFINHLYETYYSYGGDGSGRREGTPHEGFLVKGDPKATLEKFADFMVETLKQLKAHGINNVKYISIATEPGSSWNKDYKWPYDEYMDIQYEQLYDPVKAVNDALKEAGMRDQVQIVGPNETDTTFKAEMLRRFVKRSPDVFDVFTAHNYESGIFTDLDCYTQWKDLIVPKMEIVGDKPFVFDEYGWNGEGNANMRKTSGFYGTRMAVAQMAMLNSGVDGSFIWTLFDQQWPNNLTTNADNFENGLHRWGLAPTLLESSIPYKGFYSFALMGTYMGVEGSTIYAGDDTTGYGVYAAMSVLPDGNVSIAVVNTNITPTDITLNLEKAINKTLYRRVYNPVTIQPTAAARQIQADAKFSNITTRLSDTVPGGGVVIYSSVKD